MQTLIINGETVQTDAATLTALIDEMGLTGKRYAVEYDGSLVPKSQHTDFQLTEGMRLEIVQAVGGG